MPVTLAVVTAILLATLTLGGCTGLPVAPTVAPQEPDVSVIAEDLDTPWAIDFAPNGRAFVTERPGHIRVVKDGKLRGEPWLAMVKTISLSARG